MLGHYTRDGRCVAEVPCGGKPDRAYEVFPLDRLGLGPAAMAEVEDTAAGRSRSERRHWR